MSDHQLHEAVNEKNLIAAIFLNLIITLTEVVGGLVSGSLSLLSDALHNFSDCIAILISFIALRLSLRENTLKKTFGYKRAEIVAALFNASVLVIIVFFIFREAAHRFSHPMRINGVIMIIVASVGLLANFFSVFLLRKDSQKNLNIRSAYLHLLTDTISSIAVVSGGILVALFGLYWVDPVLTILIGLYVLKESYSIVRQTVNILMQATPDRIDILKIRCAIENLAEVNNLHHVHVWQVTEKDIHFEGHIDICEDLNISRIGELHRRVEELLRTEFGITHVTLQVEYGTCVSKDLLEEC